MRFFDRLQNEIDRLDSPCCVGLDPIFDKIPEKYKRGGISRASVVRGWLSDEVLPALQGVVPAVKPQMAYFELLGPSGMQALAEVTQAAAAMGFLVILDGKRGDIGDTSKAYAEAYLAKTSEYFADAITVAPYMGVDSIEPFLSVAVREDKGVFVLVRTTNPGSADLQLMSMKDDRLLHEFVMQEIVGCLNHAQEFSTAWSEHSYGPVGAVVGAQDVVSAADLRRRAETVFFLVPGYGHQGGSLEAVTACFNKDGSGAIVNSARAVLYPADGDIKAAAIRFRDEIRGARK